MPVSGAATAAPAVTSVIKEKPARRATRARDSCISRASCMRGGGLLRSDQDIRALCAKVIRAQGTDEFQSALAELRAAMREHVIDAENRGIHLILGKPKTSDKRKDGTDD